jgi:methyl-accepting chemotaxis protein
VLSPARTNLVIVSVFGVVTVLLLTRATVATVGIHDDLVHATPAFDDRPKDTLALPELDRTQTLAGGLAAGFGPLGPKFAAIDSATDTMAATAHQVRTHTDAVRTAADGIATSTTAIRTSTAELAAVVADLRAQVGDIRTAFTTAATTTGSTAASVVTMTAQAAAAAAQVRDIQADLAEVRRTLPQVARHTENIAAAKVLHDTEHARKQRLSPRR